MTWIATSLVAALPCSILLVISCHLQTISSRAPGASGDNTGAEIQLTPDGAHLLCSNRGDHDLAAFDVGLDGRLARRNAREDRWRHARHFQIDETGRSRSSGRGSPA